jgi:hypothetical protein
MAFRARGLTPTGPGVLLRGPQLIPFNCAANDSSAFGMQGEDAALPHETEVPRVQRNRGFVLSAN